MVFVALASLSVNAPLFRKGGILTETPSGTRSWIHTCTYFIATPYKGFSESESLCLLGPNPQQSEDLTIQIAAQLFYQILNLDILLRCRALRTASMQGIEDIGQDIEIATLGLMSQQNFTYSSYRWMHSLVYSHCGCDYLLQFIFKKKWTEVSNHTHNDCKLKSAFIYNLSK